MDKQELQRLRSLPIEGVAERLGLQVRRHKTLCPFHDDHHDSLTFRQATNTFRCFACGAAGNTIDLVMKHQAMSFTQACQWLANGTNIILKEWKPSQPSQKPKAKSFDPSKYAPHFSRPWLSAEAKRFLFSERKIDPRVVAWCRLTSWTDRQGTHWLETPYFSTDGKLIGVQNRNLDFRKGEAPRFRFPYGARWSIYNLPVIPMLQQGEELYITEGCSDCWAMLSAGHKAIAIPSATLLTTEDKEILLTVATRLNTTFSMYPDQDEPGERLFMQLQEIIPGIQRHQLPAGCKDFAEYYHTRLNHQHPSEPSALG